MELRTRWEESTVTAGMWLMCAVLCTFSMFVGMTISARCIPNSAPVGFGFAVHTTVICCFPLETQTLFPILGNQDFSWNSLVCSYLCELSIFLYEVLDLLSRSRAWTVFLYRHTIQKKSEDSVGVEPPPLDTTVLIALTSPMLPLHYIAGRTVALPLQFYCVWSVLA